MWRFEFSGQLDAGIGYLVERYSLASSLFFFIFLYSLFPFVLLSPVKPPTAFGNRPHSEKNRYLAFIFLLLKTYQANLVKLWRIFFSNGCFKYSELRFSMEGSISTSSKPALFPFQAFHTALLYSNQNHEQSILSSEFGCFRGFFILFMYQLLFVETCSLRCSFYTAGNK